MSDFRQYRVSRNAVEQAERFGLSGDVEGRIKLMARRAANYTHAAGNRRCDDFLMAVDGDEVLAIYQFNPLTGELLTI